MWLGPLEEFRELFSLAQPHVRLLPVGALAGKAALTLHLAVRDRRPDMLHFGAEQRFHRAFDFGLIRIERDVEDDGASVPLAQDGGLLRDQRPANDICKFHNSALLLALRSLLYKIYKLWSFSTAALVAMTRVAFIRSRAPTRELARNCTPERLRTA